MTRGRTLVLVALATACAHPQPGPEAAPTAVSLPREGMGPDQPPSWEIPASAYVGERNRCVDRELAVRKLNPYGDPEGTTYPGGSPLSLAKGADRYDYVMQHRRDIAIRCAKAPGEPER